MVGALGPASLAALSITGAALAQILSRVARLVTVNPSGFSSVGSRKETELELGSRATKRSDELAASFRATGRDRALAVEAMESAREGWSVR